MSSNQYVNPPNTHTTIFANEPNGAIITGNAKRYNTYKEMILDPAPAQLGQVLNASRDTDYPVPPEHKDGVLYEYDPIAGSWILLYSNIILGSVDPITAVSAHNADPAAHSAMLQGVESRIESKVMSSVSSSIETLVDEKISANLSWRNW